VAAAEHALAVGKANPPGLFVHLVRGRLWRYLRVEDEDRANATLKRTLWARSQNSGAEQGAPTRTGPTDAEIVRAVRSASIQAGCYRDPWPEFAKLNPGWTRDRWERSVHALP
jgi:hypothetical protein